MRKLYWSLLLLWASFITTLHAQDSAYRQVIVRKTEIEAAFSYYNQNGDHSAVTGGTGTEKLLVYAPNLKISHSFNNHHSLFFSGGADFITSASTDNIDFVKSSPSLHDTRAWLNAGYSYKFKGKDLVLNGGAGFSVESDYMSEQVKAGIEYTESSGLRTYQLEAQAYFDDLRWGRFSPDYRYPVGLVYPVELRYQNWYDTYRRNSYNFIFGFTQVIDKRTIVGIYPEIDWQHGLLATPYHRVYFTDGNEKVENLPENRIKFPFGLQVNHFTGGRVVLKGNWQFYADDFGIIGNAFKVEAAIKLNPVFTIIPMYRFYTQKGTSYFAPYGESRPGDTYYSADFDLSSFNTNEAGVLLIYSPEKYYGKHTSINEINLQYNYFIRTNGLYAHYLTFWVTLDFERNRRIKSSL
jgi:hypothetical protein